MADFRLCHGCYRAQMWHLFLDGPLGDALRPPQPSREGQHREQKTGQSVDGDRPQNISIE